MDADRGSDALRNLIRPPWWNHFVSPDPWSWNRAGKELLDLLPEIVAFIAGGSWSLLLVGLTRKKAKKDWDAAFMSRYKEEARSEIRERDAHIVGLEERLKDAKKLNRELARRAKAAVIMSGKVSETLATADFTQMSQFG
jgi:hypothetical protein